MDKLLLDIYVLMI